VGGMADGCAAWGGGGPRGAGLGVVSSGSQGGAGGLAASVARAGVEGVGCVAWSGVVSVAGLCGGLLGGGVRWWWGVVGGWGGWVGSGPQQSAFRAFSTRR